MTQTMEMVHNPEPDQQSATALLRRVVSDDGEFANLLDTSKFEHLWRVAKLFSASAMVPAQFQNKPEDCFIATQMAIRLGIDPFMFMQNTYVYKGKPGMEGKLAIALINSSGLFAGPLHFDLTGTGDDRGCVAWAMSKQTGERLDGPRVSITTAKAEGWFNQNAKWRTIPDMMLRYRAGSWFGRLYCPERLMGMQTIDEIRDVEGTGPSEPISAAHPNRTAALLAKITNRPVSEGQTLEPTPEAAAQAEAEATQQQSTDSAPAQSEPNETPEPDVSGIVEEQAPEAPKTVANFTNWEGFKLAMDEAAMDLEVAPTALNKMINVGVVALGKKGHETAISIETLKDWYGRFIIGEGHFKR